MIDGLGLTGSRLVCWEIGWVGLAERLVGCRVSGSGSCMEMVIGVAGSQQMGCTVGLLCSCEHLGMGVLCEVSDPSQQLLAIGGPDFWF